MKAPNISNHPISVENGILNGKYFKIPLKKV